MASKIKAENPTRYAVIPSTPMTGNRFFAIAAPRLTEICPPNTASEGSKMLSGRGEVEAGEVMGRYFNTPEAGSRWQIGKLRRFH